jgi:uncharacterized membrane protein
MPSPDREDIHIISRNSNWSAPGVHKALKEQVYNNQSAWQRFLKLLFISLGIGFTTAGIVFFFAYNWDNLHKFVKIGLIEGLVIVSTLLIVFSRLSTLLKNILLTGAAVLVGVLMAVFGQVYQTGANAYDLFLSWTLAITIWVVVANFPPLWLVYALLINTTLNLYAEQVANHWPDELVYFLQFLVNTALLLGVLFMAKKNTAASPSWFRIILALAAATTGTIAMMAGIYGHKGVTFLVMFPTVAILYTLGFFYGLRQKSLFYISVISFSAIVIIAAWFIDLSHDAGMYLFASLFIIASITFLIKKLIDLQKQWAHEKGA